jgi:D-lactate dehydrogenase
VGFNLHLKTVGLIGTGRIGLLTGKILSLGMGCKVIAYDPYPNVKMAAEYGITYVDTLHALLRESDIVSLHCPLLESTHHILNGETIPLMKKGVVLVNASRGALVETKALIQYARSTSLPPFHFWFKIPCKVLTRKIAAL